jgi:arginine-tRNA-protein transferase
MARTCCPQYTIRLEALEYKPNKKHRQVINRFNRYLLTGEKPGDPEASTSGASVNNGKNKTNGKGKGKKGKDTEIWIDSLRAQQLGYGGGTSTHKFEVGPTPMCQDCTIV